jgi:hypothetical protein
MKHAFFYARKRESDLPNRVDAFFVIRPQALFA